MRSLCRLHKFLIHTSSLFLILSPYLITRHGIEIQASESPASNELPHPNPNLANNLSVASGTTGLIIDLVDKTPASAEAARIVNESMQYA